MTLPLSCCDRQRRRQMRVFKDLGIPGPEPHFLFGNLIAFKDKMMWEQYRLWSDTYGETFGSVTLCVCVCACVRARARVCVCVCVCSCCCCCCCCCCYCYFCMSISMSQLLFFCVGYVLTFIFVSLCVLCSFIHLSLLAFSSFFFIFFLQFAHYIIG